MGKLITKQQTKVLASVFLSALLFSSAIAQDRGKFSFACPPAEVILQQSKLMPVADLSPAKIQPSVFSQKFVSAVGGISFGNTALFHPSLEVSTLRLSYNREKPDGERTELQINGNPVKLGVYDWILLPVARYADTGYTSLFTYFGKLKDKQLEETILENGGHILNYHPVMQNTLLGWRLADMDMLIMYDFTEDLPKLNGRYVLGAGENVPDLTANQQGAYYYLNHLKKIEEKLGYAFQSYVITDYPLEITCTVQNDSLVISGFPYYYCWRYKMNEPGFNDNSLVSDISRNYENIIKINRTEDPGFDVRDFFIDSLINITMRYEEGYNLYRSGTINDLMQLKSTEERKAFLSRYATESLSTMAIEVTAGMVANTPVYLKAFSDQMSAHPEMIAAFNPAVWNATVATMRFSAFFRFVKENFPDEWKKFISSMAGVEPLPAVQTPTVIYDKGNSFLEKQFR